MFDKIGFIGTGNMGSAVAHAVAGQGRELLLANRTTAKAQNLADAVGGRVVKNPEAAGESELLFLCVKPQMMADMLADIAPILAARESRFILVSMAAALTIADIQEMANTVFNIQTLSKLVYI